MPSPATTPPLQQANPSIATVSRQPQTTAQPSLAGAPFIRLSRKSQSQGFVSSGNAYGSLINMPLKAVGGYLRGLWITVIGSAWGTAGTVPTGQFDAPWNVIQTLLFKDPLGTPIIQTDGYGLMLMNVFGSQCGMAGLQPPWLHPSFSALTTTGVFAFKVYMPLELDESGYCALPDMNASAQPSLTINLNSIAAVFSGSAGGAAPTGTAGTVTVIIEQDYYAVPVAAPDVAPPGVGSSAQWSQATVAELITSSSTYVRATMPRVGTWIHALLLVARGANGFRVAEPTGGETATSSFYPFSDLQLLVDSVQVRFERYLSFKDKVYRQFGLASGASPGAGIGGTEGVLPWSFREGTMHLVGNADTYDELLATTPATLLELAGTYNTAALSSSPYQITAYTGELYPVGGIPYTHLAN